MSVSRSCAVLSLLLAWLVGCGAPPPADVSASGAVRLAIALPAGSFPGEVTRVTVTVSAPDLSPLTQELVGGGGLWGGVLSELPAGAHRTFLAQAFDGDNNLLYEGRAEDVTVMAGSTGRLTLTLQEQINHDVLLDAPVLDALTFSPTSVAPGGSVFLNASAHGTFRTLPMSFVWSAPSGRFTSSMQSITTWTAPTAPGPVTLTLQVSDPYGTSITMSFTVDVHP